MTVSVLEAQTIEAPFANLFQTLFQPSAFSCKQGIMKKIWLLSLALLLALSSCKTIRQGNVGVKRTVGKIHDRSYPAGPRWYNPLVSRIIIVPVNTQNIEVNLPLPSKEGLNVGTEISILYHLDESKATDIIGTIGED